MITVDKDKRNWLFLRKKILKKTLNNLEEVECISKYLETVNKLSNRFLEEVLSVETINNLKKHFFEFDIISKESNFDLKSHININNARFSSNNLKYLEKIEDEISKAHLKIVNVYTRQHMLWLYHQEKLHGNKTIKNISKKPNYYTKNSEKKNKKINSIKKFDIMNKIESFSKWTENCFEEGVVSVDDIIKSIYLVLPFIPVHAEFHEPEIKCADNFKNNQVDELKKNQNLIMTKKQENTSIRCSKILRKNDKLDKIRNEKITNKNEKKQVLVNKLRNATGVKLYIDYAKEKNGKLPLGI